jgi:hypothetical protein
MNAWRYTSTPQYASMAWCLVKQRDNFTLLYFTLLYFALLCFALLYILGSKPADFSFSQEAFHFIVQASVILCLSYATFISSLEQLQASSS